MEIRGLVCLCFAFVLVNAAGCTVSKFAKGDPGVDVGQIEAGLTKKDAEAILGSPTRCWTGDQAVKYCLYHYDGGRPPRWDDASAALFMDVISLGLWELFSAIEPITDENYARVRSGIILSFDEADIVTGKFDEFAKLPGSNE